MGDTFTKLKSALFFCYLECNPNQFSSTDIGVPVGHMLHPVVEGGRGLKDKEGETDFPASSRDMD